MVEVSIIGAEVTRMLSDSKADLRKRGAAEIDRKVQLHCSEKDWGAVHNLIRLLKNSFTHSVQNSLRKGGLLAISAVAIALGNGNIGEFVYELVEAAIELFQDQDPTVRYHAAECLYNIAKVARGLLLVEFGEIFTGICNLKSDNDRAVQNASDTLDGILRDIATESKEFNVELFVRTIRKHVVSTKPRIRQYVLSWLLVLETADINLVDYLPEFLGGVLDILADPDKKIAGLADKVLSAYLQRLRDMVSKDMPVQWQRIISIIIDGCMKRDDRTRGSALAWVVEFLCLSKYKMVESIPELLKVVLTCMADKEKSIKDNASVANGYLASLFGAAKETGGEIEEEVKKVLPDVFDSLTNSLSSGEIATKSSALQWLHMVLEAYPDLISSSYPSLFPDLLRLLGDPSDQVVELSLQVLAMITRGSSSNFHRFLSELVSFLQVDGFKHMSRAGMIVKILAKITPPEELFSILASIIPTVTDLGFVSSLVTNLNIVLLTSPELLPLRNILKKGLNDEKAKKLFTELYYCWSFNAVSLVSLCLLAKAYKHAYDLIRTFGEQEITVSMLVQIDKLIQMLESPVFTYIRLALLEPNENPYLIKALFGVLMLLPQSTAFDDLHKRLKSVNTVCNLNAQIRSDAATNGDDSSIEWDKLLEHYKSVETDKEAFVKSGGNRATVS
eukprot:TRINITY_DN1741_c2_g4_i1.p1 TRINITY_DN1741_c2_g4~~TRINITY_DN1741_c2_g4_i1.p1  ORF type:complete len:674 (+),score=173.09 TRINITY_DN1741_c2_g4_i1:134-2155(+)